jgi:hypothetical protein
MSGQTAARLAAHGHPNLHGDAITAALLAEAGARSACGFVATATMPTGLRQFAEYQPFTPVADTVRGLLSGAAIGDHAIAAIAWSIGIAVVAYLWAIRLYNRRRAAEPK